MAILKTPTRSVPRPAWRLLGRALVGLAVLAASGPRLLGQDNGPAALEYQIKAAFLFNFAKFVEWPPGKLGEPRSRFAVCVLGKDPFGSVLDQALQGKTIDGRPVFVRRSASVSDCKDCHIVFISSSERERLAEVLQVLANASALTVSEMPRFAERGGMINFTTDDNKVRLEINAGSAASAGIRISSKLLNLAKVVRATPAGGQN